MLSRRKEAEVAGIIDQQFQKAHVNLMAGGAEVAVSTPVLLCTSIILGAILMGARLEPETVETYKYLLIGSGMGLGGTLLGHGAYRLARGAAEFTAATTARLRQEILRRSE